MSLNRNLHIKFKHNFAYTFELIYGLLSFDNLIKGVHARFISELRFYGCCHPYFPYMLDAQKCIHVEITLNIITNFKFY